MRVNSVSFGNEKPPVYNHDTAEREAIRKLVKYWQETGDFRMARIDFYEGGEPKITLVGEKHVKKVKPEGYFSKFLKNLTRIIKK